MGSLDPRRGPRVFLGDTLDADKVAADYAAGVLTLTVLVREDAKPRSIQVTSSDRAGRHRRTFPGAGQSVPILDDPYRPPPTQPPGPATRTAAPQPLHPVGTASAGKQAGRKPGRSPSRHPDSSCGHGHG